MADLKLKDLRYLVAVADERHFGRAARKSCVSQPTLSAQLRKLEDYLGVRLIERQPRRVALTEAGQQVVARARRILQESDEIVSMARHSGDPLTGTLKVAFIPTIGPYLLPRVAPRLRRALPKLKLLLFEHQTVLLLERLHAGAIDLGILALPVDLAGLESRVLFDEPFSVALNPGNPLAQRKALRPADLDGQTLLLLEDGHCLRDQALEVCARVDVHESSDYRATSLETLRQMVAAGHGITLLPQMALHGPYAGARNLAMRPFAKPVPKRQIGAVWRRSSTRMPAIQAVCDTIASTVRR
ncbi:MAG TPA: LysR substrate-binding domain-containing protein [Steroidobacteraceae bacterium]|nr:LysR substrate-binding domain-containing protein [Steroidobacteraceae bacterium]